MEVIINNLGRQVKVNIEYEGDCSITIIIHRTVLISVSFTSVKDIDFNFEKNFHQPRIIQLTSKKYSSSIILLG